MRMLGYSSMSSLRSQLTGWTVPAEQKLPAGHDWTRLGVGQCFPGGQSSVETAIWMSGISVGEGRTVPGGQN